MAMLLLLLPKRDERSGAMLMPGFPTVTGTETIGPQPSLLVLFFESKKQRQISIAFYSIAQSLLPLLWPGRALFLRTALADLRTTAGGRVCSYSHRPAGTNDETKKKRKKKSTIKRCVSGAGAVVLHELVLLDLLICTLAAGFTHS